jgi:hypothetical protein
MNRNDETGMWSFFKPRTWFRNNQTKVEQRLKSINAINSTLKTQTTHLNYLVDKKEYQGKIINQQIDDARTSLQKTLDKSLKNKKGINKYVGKGKSYIFPVQDKAKQAIDASQANTYRQNPEDREKRNMFNNQRHRDDEYDDNNYNSGVSGFRQQ